ncbi:MAG: VWA domain-containing protein [Deltaproteobacteria bacterium]|nr:VWA domain-containing protein [Deltaproteobacteria bacterium]
MSKTCVLAVTTLATALLTACGDIRSQDADWMTAGGLGDDTGDGDDHGDGDGDGGGRDGGGEGGADDGDGGMADDGGSAPACYRETFDLSEVPPEVMLVLDKSGSMSDEQWLHDGELVTRWSSLHAVVSDLLHEYDDAIDFGATLFPSLDAGPWQEGFSSACTVADVPEVPTGPNAAAAILSTLPDPDAIVQGATPASAGMVTALQHLGLGHADQRAIVLVTDGLANCADHDDMFLYDEALPLVVQTAHQQLGIPTYVVGVDIRDALVDYAQANAHDALSEVARAGGAARVDEVAYYSADDEDALHEAIDDIAARIECTVRLSDPAPLGASVDVHVGGQPQAEVADCSTDDGWRFSDPVQRSHIELCGSACDDLRVEGTLETRVCEGATILPVP